MPTTPWLIPLFALTLAACNPVASNDAGPEVCREHEREVLVAEQLSPETRSTPFTIRDDEDIWVGLIADSDFSPDALFSQVTGLYATAEGDPVEYTRDSAGAVVTDDPYLDYDREGQFRRLELPPGTYQLWSVKAPDITVVSCEPRADEG